LFKDFINTNLIPQRTDVTIVSPTKKEIRERLYKEQNGLCNGCGVAFELRNLDTDHIIPLDKGGGSYYENYQLLCANCNRVKGTRPMEYLRMKIKAREKLLGDKIIFGE
jgi:site-specific DNA-methyltransferase (adenine-specific)